MFGLNDPFGLNSHINSLMNSFMMDPFAASMQQQQQHLHQQQHQQQLMRNSRSRSNQVAARNPYEPFENMMLSPFQQQQQQLMSHHHRSAMSNPFALMDQMMGGFGRNVFDNMAQMRNDPNAQVFSSSTVMTYSNSGDGQPKIYQESTQTKQVPGGIKETRHVVRDSERGFEKVAVGHHIGERAHVVERHKKNNGDLEEIVNLENLDDNEVNEFNEEFENKIRSAYTNNHHHSHRTSHLGNNHQPLAIEDNSSRHSKKDRDRKSKSKSKH